MVRASASAMKPPGQRLTPQQRPCGKVAAGQGHRAVMKMKSDLGPPEP